MTPLTPERPQWLGRSERQTDITDFWRETCGEPDCEDECFAHFEGEDEAYEEFTNIGHGDYIVRQRWHRTFTLLGIEVHDSTGTRYADAEWTQKVFGADAIWNMEQHEMEAAA